MPRTAKAANGKISRKPNPARVSIPPGLWVSLAASLVLLGPCGAQAGEGAKGALPGATLILVSAHLPAPQTRAAPAPEARATPQSAPRSVLLVLSAGRLSKPLIQGEGAGHRNPFTRVGNRAGLEDAGRVEVRNGEIWLVASPARETGLAAFQGEGSSVASR